MPILLVTARNAEKSVRECVEDLGVPVRIHVCDADVAALLSVERIARELSKIDLKGVSEIIIPGTVAGDATLIARKTGVPCIKGPRHIADLPMVLEAVSEKRVRLSPRLPADDVLRKEISAEMDEELLRVCAKPKKYSLKIGRKTPVYLGCGISHVIAEVPDAPRLREKDLLERAAYYVSSGARIVDLGMIAGEDNSKSICDMVEAVRSKVDVPLSIDSLDVKEILAAADAGVDLILSIDLRNCGILDCVSVPAVAIPRDDKGIVPRKLEEKISILESIMRNTEGKNIILDPVLSPLNLGFTESLEAYIRVREAYPDKPMMMGAGNVTELLDADSPGVNALLAGISSELDIDLLFTTEASEKTRGCARELATAARMMYISKKRKQAPKDLGADLLILKDKRKRGSRPDDIMRIESIFARAGKAAKLEETEFRIYAAEKIQVICYRRSKPVLKVAGDSARDIYQTVIERGFVKDLSHAAYLGRELSKAEIALSLGKDYVQDEELF